MKNIKPLIAALSVIACICLLLSGCAPKQQTSPVTTTVTSPVNTQAPQTTETPSTTKPKYSSSDKLIALTYDDGPNNPTTNQILDVLEANNSTATFFIVGSRISFTQATLQRAVDMKCEIANHTFDHKTLPKLNSEERSNQIKNTNDAIKEACGYESVLLRAPGGAVKDLDSSVGMPLIQWSIDTEDWKYSDSKHEDRSEDERNADINKIVNDVLAKVEPGDIILMHDIYEFTADMSEILIPRLVEEGYTLVTVSELCEHYGTELKPGEVYFNSSVKEP